MNEKSSVIMERMIETGQKIIERILSLNNELQILCGETLKEVWVGDRAFQSVAYALTRSAVFSKDADGQLDEYENDIIYVGSTKVRRAD